MASAIGALSPEAECWLIAHTFSISRAVFDHTPMFWFSSLEPLDDLYCSANSFCLSGVLLSFPRIRLQSYSKGGWKTDVKWHWVNSMSEQMIW